ncbi:hypothetical protein [Spirosoma sp.]|uniref:hypothetical protein n=1 Tax=Spirosoma sp. TaxID=1899569 RepID=UPI002602E398|nr:hypothetical protein [Spirosoma sp.]MCX6216511.1 hypothetical protein [Spirosoma sp.]
MNAGFIKQIKAAIAATKNELADKRAGHPDSELSEEQENKLLDQLGVLTELLQQFDE